MMNYSKPLARYDIELGACFLCLELGWRKFRWIFNDTVKSILIKKFEKFRKTLFLPVVKPVLNCPYMEGGNSNRFRMQRGEMYTDMTIKIRYIFVNREWVHLDFPDDDAAAQFIVADRKKEASAKRKERRHTYSLDAIVYAGEEYQDRHHSPELLLIEKECEEEIVGWTNQLTEAQRRRLLMRLQGMSIREIAEAEGVSQQRISYTFKQISKKL